MIRAIVFDFDGVIIDSTSVKTEAFVETYSDCSASFQDYVRQYHEDNQGCPRREKIEHFASVIGETQLTSVEKRIECFAELAFAKVKASPLFAGVDGGLKDLKQGRRLYVASATPAAELEETLEVKQISDLFETSWGFPVRKADAINLVRKRHDFERGEILMIGDSAADREAAVEAGVPFLGVAFGGEKHPFPESCPVVHDFSEIKVFVERCQVSPVA